MRNYNIWTQPFIGQSITEDGITITYCDNGDSTVVLKIENVAVQFCADADKYKLSHEVFGQFIKMLGEGYIIHKSDIISTTKWKAPEQIATKNTDYLTERFFNEYNGREYRGVVTYLSITKTVSNGKLYVYNKHEEKTFIQNIHKILDIFEMNKISAKVLDAAELKQLHNRYLAMNFTDESFAIDNFESTETGLQMGDKDIFSLLLLDTDDLNIPNAVTPFSFKPELGSKFPADNFNFLFNIPEADVIIYNQIVSIPNQNKVKIDLTKKRKQHRNMPAESNNASIRDIDAMFVEIAETNEMIVNACMYTTVLVDRDKRDKPFNALRNYLFGMGIIPNKKTSQQLELWRGGIPGNASEIRDNNYFPTSRPASLCFFFNENLPVTDNSDYLLWFMDRQGVPIGIDTWELPMATQQITNRNKFILGPSGSGKSFFTNRYVKQCIELGADVVIIDTGDSYLGTNKYFNGKYVTYTQEKPITMNPFKFPISEMNEEKLSFLISLVGLLWKGADGTLSEQETSLITKVINEYYNSFFDKKSYQGIKEIKSDVHSNTDENRRLKFAVAGSIVKSAEWELTTIQVEDLSFNTFYEFAISRIPLIIDEKKIEFPFYTFKFILEKFYKGGAYDTILNENSDTTLFNEKFIVFEIDNIKEHKTLFPITTLIIMDVFLQKMKRRRNTKKILIIEEAWKAIASPIMAGYILYLYKTIRKYDGEAIVVTQELDDIIGNAVVKNSIINNSDTTILLDQRKLKDRYKEVSEILSLNEIEKKKIFTINNIDNKSNRGAFKEVYIKMGAVGQVYGVEVPIEEYFTYTTAKAERECLEVFLHHYPTYREAMDNMVYVLRNSNMRMHDFVRHINGTFLSDKELNPVFKQYMDSQNDFKIASLKYLQFINSKN